MSRMLDTIEIFVQLKEGFDSDTSQDKVISVLDREELNGVALPFSKGIGLYIEEIPKSFDIVNYKREAESSLKQMFGAELLGVEFKS